jgi:hypothetical protein
MNLSPQSQAALERLWQGQTLTCGSLSIGPLADDAVRALRVIVDQFDDLRGRAGVDQARALRTAYAAALVAEDEDVGGDAPCPVNAPSLVGAVPVVGVRCSWRLVRMKCKNIRGVAPFDEIFTFEYDGRSTLLYGPNASGKSSLLGAVIWGLTGKTVTDAAEVADTSPVYCSPDSSGKPSRIRDWPVMHTLPAGSNVRTATTDCWVLLELRSADTSSRLHFRRSLARGLEASADGLTWMPCSSLEPHGISPLDLQLSLIAPSVFSRQSIESAADARNLLSLMLGYDDLELIGNFVSNVARNRTILANAERQANDGMWAELRGKLGAQPARLREGLPVRAEVLALANRDKPTVAELDAVSGRVEALIAAAETDVARLIGLPVREDGGAPQGLADALTGAVLALEKGVWQNFQSLAQLRLEVALPLLGEESPQDRLSGLRGNIEQFVNSARARIGSRFEWWQRETAPGSKASLLIRAAQRYDPDLAQCPVCERPLNGLPVQRELTELKAADQALLQTLTELFHNLRVELDEIVPTTIWAAGENGPPRRLLDDWNEIQQAIGPQLSSVVSRFDAPIQRVLESMSPVEFTSSATLPTGADGEFSTKAAHFVERLRAAEQGLAVLTWGETNLDIVERSLQSIVTPPSSSEAESLCAALSKGKQAAQDIAPLAAVRSELSSAKGLCETITSAETQYSVLDGMKDALDPLKRLTNYAATQVESVFGAIKQKTIALCRTLYPETPSGQGFQGQCSPSVSSLWVDT